MKQVIKFYRLFNLLSLDVASGAMICSIFFSKIYDAPVSYPSLISLGLTVWMIYTADRLLDIHDVEGDAASERHRFHQRNQQKLKYGILMAMFTDIALIFFMPMEVIWHGIFLSGAVAIYILFRRKLHISKELLIAILYAVGVLLPAWPHTSLSSIQYLPILMLFLIALTNLIIFSWYEKESDLKDGQDSIATLIDESSIRFILVGLFVVTISISIYLFFITAYQFISLIFIAMIMVLFMIFSYKKYFEPSEYYRLVGDAVFLFPIIYIFS